MPEPDDELSDVFPEAALFVDDGEDAPSTSNGSSSGTYDVPTVEDVPSTERAPQHARTGPRTPLTDLIALVWSGAGTVLQRSDPVNVPVGRVLRFQAPIAGVRIDALISGTVVDRFLQPFAKHVDSAQGVGELVALPLMVAAYTRNPEIGFVIEPILRQVIEAQLLDMAPMLKKQAAKTRKAAESIGDLTETFDLQPGENPVDAVLAMWFAAPDGYTPPEPQTEQEP